MVWEARSSQFEKLFFVLGKASFLLVGVLTSVRLVSRGDLTRLVKAKFKCRVVAIFLATFQLASDSSCLGRTNALWAVSEDLEYCAVGNLA